MMLLHPSLLALDDQWHGEPLPCLGRLPSALEYPPNDESSLYRLPIE